MTKFAHRLKKLREDSNLRQQDLADKLGYARTTIANYEQSIRLPPLDTLFAIADFFQVSLDFLLGRTDVKLTTQQMIYDRVNVPVLIINPETGLIFDCNEMAVNFYGYAKSELLKMKIYSINMLSDNDVHFKMHEVLKNQQGTYHFRHRLADGRIKDVQIFSGPLIINGTTYIYSVIHDISNQKKQYINLSQVKKNIHAFKKIFNSKIPNKKNHHLNVLSMALTIADKLKLKNQTINMLQTAAGVHDIGLLMIPTEFTYKSNSLNIQELEFYRKHPIYGADLTKDINSQLSMIIMQHHEYIDGSGYPYGLIGNEIKLEAKIITLADTIDNMTCNRNYRSSKEKKAILSHLNCYKGRRYDKIITEAVIKLMEDDLI